LRQISEVLEDTGIYLISDENIQLIYISRPNAPRRFGVLRAIDYRFGFVEIFEYDGCVGGCESQQTSSKRAHSARFLAVCTSSDSQKARVSFFIARAGRKRLKEAKRDARAIYKRRGRIFD
jgi:hypothetical protein